MEKLNCFLDVEWDVWCTICCHGYENLPKNLKKIAKEYKRRIELNKLEKAHICHGIGSKAQA